MNKIASKTLLFLLAALWCADAGAQKVAVKTNLLYDIAAYTINVGVEAPLATR
ncbi:DUF3575 domain-containing protein, partial [uncultured Alistipes sp.]